MTSSDRIYDVIIVGSGVEGSATGYYLTSRHTKNVVLLEQFSGVNTRGSSHGGSRAIEKACHKAYYIKMMNEAFPIWLEIEERFGKQIYGETGKLFFGDSSLIPLIKLFKENEVPHTVLSGREANERYPKQFKLPDDYVCVYIKEDAGILKADVALNALQTLYISNGGQLLDYHRVLRVIPGPVITIETDRGSFKSKKIVITAGAWTNQLLETVGLKLPLKVLRTAFMYWPVENPADFSTEVFPGFLTEHADSCCFGGLPIEEYHGLVKVTYTSGPEIDPDERDSSPSEACELVSRFIAKHLRGFSSTKPAIVEPCMYTVTPDCDLILDCHPKYANIIIGAGFSGYGFHLAPVVGKILAELALEKPLSFDLSPFRINRFSDLHNPLN